MLWGCVPMVVFFISVQFSWAPPPYSVGMHPHGHNSCSRSNRLTGTSTLHCRDVSPWLYFSDFTVSWTPPPYTAGMHPHGHILVLSTLGHLHPLLITRFYQLVRPWGLFSYICWHSCCLISIGNPHPHHFANLLTCLDTQAHTCGLCPHPPFLPLQPQWHEQAVGTLFSKNLP